MDTNDFVVRKFYVYNGPSHYLPAKALVFNLKIAPYGPEVDFYSSYIYKVFPKLRSCEINTVVELFAHTLLETLRMDIDLYINKFAISRDDDEYVVAIEYLDEYIAEDAANLVSQWFKSINRGNETQFNFAKKYASLKAVFDRSLMGGPTLYSLIETAMKNEVPVFFLEEENQFQWGYGSKQLRGRSTIVHTDGIKDTEFTMFKDMVSDFLFMCGFPTPKGRNCYTEKEALLEAQKLGFPLVIKPVSGHKGIGVTTGIQNETEVLLAFRKIVAWIKKDAVFFDGVVVQQHISGHDHRLLTIEGKFVAALKRIPAYIDGNGKDAIGKLIETENLKDSRLDNARSPLSKIHIDDDLTDFLSRQSLNLESVPLVGQRIFLRSVANISAGGVSINVTNDIHPKNIQLAESIASFFHIKCLGIDVLANDISLPWDQGDFGIIEINSGPGVFMHLTPAFGEGINVPQLILNSHFKTPQSARIPIIAGNKIDLEFMHSLVGLIKQIDEHIIVGSLVAEGVFFDNSFLHKNKHHDQNIKIILRYPKTAFAIINHTKEDIYDYGFYHQGVDIIIMDHPNPAERTLCNQLLPQGYIFEVSDKDITLSLNSRIIKTVSYTESEKQIVLLMLINPLLTEIYFRYNV